MRKDLDNRLAYHQLFMGYEFFCGRKVKAFGRILLKQRDKECKKSTKWTLGHPHLKERIKALTLASRSTSQLHGGHAVKKVECEVDNCHWYAR